VLYEAGAVPAGEIGAGLADLGDVLYVVPPASAHVEQLRPVMELIGTVHTLSGDLATDTMAVAAIAPDAILTFSEPMIRPAAEMAAALGLPGHPVATAQIFTDKGLQRQVLREAGVDDTRTAVIRSPEELPEALLDVGLPAIVKPVTGSASKDTWAVRSAVEARDIHDRLENLFEQGFGRPFIIEQFLEGRPSGAFGDYVSVESTCTAARISNWVLTGKTPVSPPFRGNGRIWPSHLDSAEEREIFDLVTRSLTAVGATYGFAHTEVKLTPDGPRIIEINGRLSAHVNMMARDACGLDLVRLGGLVALGEQPALPPFDFGGKVHFQYNNLAPIRPGRLTAVHGVQQVRALPGVTAYRNFVRPGDNFPGGSTTWTLDTISGICADHDSVARVITAARSALTFEIEFDDGIELINGMDLPRY
jgi:biotin carboxylase